MVKVCSSSSSSSSSIAILKVKMERKKRYTAKMYKRDWEKAINDRQSQYMGRIESSHGVTWIRGSLLGQGSFGSVFIAQKTPNINVGKDWPTEELPSVIAVKSADIREADSLKNEKKILCAMNCSIYVIRCYGAEITKSGNGEKTFYNILLEYCSGGNLYSRIKYSNGLGLPENEVKGYTRDIVFGLQYIHCLGYAHCDIKPNNILLVADDDSNRYQAKIGDFGLAKVANYGQIDEEDYEFGMRGTYRYMSPEIVVNKITEPAGDIWALGCTVIEMLSGKPVWDFEYNSQLNQEKIDSLLSRIGGSFELPEMPSSISEECRDFLTKCLVKDARYRWVAEALARHPFLRDD